MDRKVPYSGRSETNLSVGRSSVLKVPHWFQKEAVEAQFKYWAEGGKAGLIALPTGTGKGLVIALLNYYVMQQWPDTRILNLTHVHTLISQNFEELIELWPTAPAGICSSGLGRLDHNHPILLGGVQTVVNRLGSLGRRDLVLIDEAHLLSPKAETSYQKVISGLRATQPALRISGLSATIWRLGQGLLTEDGIFTDVVYDMTSFKNFNRLLKEDYLVPLIPKRTHTEIDLTGVHVDGYKYNERELDAASNTRDLNERCCAEMIEMAHDRQSWLTFCASIDHAEKVNAILRRSGIDSDVVHSKKGKEHNDRTIQRWKEGKLRSIVNKDMLTTGVNNPRCDFIACLRGLVSSSLWVQLLGRGTRTRSQGDKANCLVADFAGNTKRLGPINDPVIPRKPGKGNRPSSVPIRICESCGTYNHASARVCTNCGTEFPVNTRLGDSASEADLIKSDTPEIHPFTVRQVVYNLHRGKDKPSLKVDYHVGDGRRKFQEFVCFEHEGFAGKKARDWWRSRSIKTPPTTVGEALDNCDSLRVPKLLYVHVNTRYPEIKKVEF